MRYFSSSAIILAAKIRFFSETRYLFLLFFRFPELVQFLLDSRCDGWDVVSTLELSDVLIGHLQRRVLTTGIVVAAQLRHQLVTMATTAIIIRYNGCLIICILRGQRLYSVIVFK